MASNQLPQIPDLFYWNPPKLSLRELTTDVSPATSDKTHEPAFFDRHFSAKLKLLHVRPLPTLILDLTATADKALAHSIQLALPMSHFHSTDAILATLSDLEKALVDENELASFYERTTASFSIRAASLLALGARRLLRWSRSANVSGSAIADGFLYFPDPTDPALAVLYAQLEARLGKETVDLIRSLGRDRSSLATYKFKNVAAAGREEEVMLAVPALSNLSKFPWTGCTAPDCEGITVPLGLFDDVQGGACALVMPYVVGSASLADMPDFVLTSSYREAILATLKEIHRADVLHCDLRLANVLVVESGGHAIIDFGRSRVCGERDEKDSEYSCFEALLVRRGKWNGRRPCTSGCCLTSWATGSGTCVGFMT